MAYSRRPKSREEFLAEADSHPPETPNEPISIAAGLGSTGFDSEGVKGVIERAQAKPWVGLDPKGLAKQAFSLRLNDYEFAILRWLVEQNEDLSMQKVVRRILVPELQRKIGETR